MNKKKYLVKIKKIRNFEVFIVTSMTGYSYHEVSTEKAVISVEFKSVNSRFLDLNINLPSFLNFPFGIVFIYYHYIIFLTIVNFPLFFKEKLTMYYFFQVVECLSFFLNFS